jgi:DNA-binding transcriptional MocR family regulator
MLDRTPHAPAVPTLIGGIMETIRGRIAARRLAPGARLPSIRRLAESERVSKSTVVEAYERLAAEGLIAARPGSGFYVAGRPLPAAPAADAPRVERTIDPFWVMRQSLEADGAALMPGCGWLPEGWMPTDAIRKALRAASRDRDGALVDYGPPLGFAPLRAQLARRLAESGVPAPPSQILLTDSGSQAIDLVCRLLLREGDAVLVDDPCYFNFLGLARVHRAAVHGVPMTPTGPDLEAFARLTAQHRPRLYLTNTAIHNPTGASLAPATAHRLLTLAEAAGMVVVEDDIFADFEPGPPGPRLAALDGLARVVRVGSFSKTLSAAARCGYIAAGPDWIEALTDLKLATSFGNGDLAARLVHRLLTDGSYRRHVEAVRERLARALPETARRLTDAGLTLWSEPRGGLFLWASLPSGLDSADIARRAMAEGVVLAPGNVFSITQSAGRYVRFNVAQCADPQIFAVLRRLVG